MVGAEASLHPFFAKLTKHGDLSSEERDLIEEAVTSVTVVSAGDDLVLAGTSQNHSSLLLEGFSARYNLTADGNRQMTSVHVPGDFIDLPSFLMKPMDHSILALSDCKLAVIPHDAIARITSKSPNLNRLLWLDTLIDGGAHRRWTFCVGSLEAHRHLAHILCELYLRLWSAPHFDRTGGIADKA